ncbi:MAG: TIGR04222 domain-containing membrane protein [Novosphingobium sp.]|nr:TIGR04222 domain-containing membrane protein [Novosphingobium sp.]
MDGLGVFDLRGEQFLWLYGVLAVLTVFAGLAIPRWLRPDGRYAPVSDSEDLAYLAGGSERLGEAVVARLLSVKALEAGRARFAILRSDDGRTPAERTVLGLGIAASWKEIRKAVGQDAQRIDERLTGWGLIIDGATRLQMRFWQTSPYIALLFFGAVKWQVGVSRDKPVETLTVFMIITAIAAVLRFAALDLRTREGLAVLASAKAVSDRMRRAPLAQETGMAVALFGTSVLAGSQFATFHQLRTNSGTSGGCGGGDSGCGGGGGGGCGGCGD